MTSLTGLTKAEMLTQALEFIAQTLSDCGFEICAQQRTHFEPRTIQCCEDCNGNSYALVGWVVRSYSSDARLNEVPSADCPSLDATMFGFTIARCWPESATIPKIGGPMDEVAVELMDVLDCLQAALSACEQNPSLFRPLGKPGEVLHCIRLQVGAYTSEKNVVATPYGDPLDGGKVSAWCAGWRWSITVA